jgi:osmotically-inducible protein OsmY
MKSDAELKRDVEAELKWTPDVDETDVAVKVKAGEVTLTGYVDDYIERYQAEIAVKRVAGVGAVANDIQVRSMSGAPTDPEIARAALAALKFEMPLIWESIKIVVHESRITLEGKVEWNFQRGRAENAVRRLSGVTSVLNLIRIEPKVAPKDIKHKIEAAFQRIAQVDSDRITVEAEGSNVTLRGEVRSWAEHDQAQQTAWSAPGVVQVINELRVRT